MDYPFVKCLSPKTVYNKYTGERLVVGCGHCKACLASAASRASSLCSIEETQHKFAIFVTLTYSNAYVPVYSYSFDNGQVVVKSEVERFGNKGEVVYVDDASSLSIYNLISSRSLLQSGHFMPLCKRDFQLFNKRFRKELTNYTDEKVRFYAVGEYGPIHLRPHFHAIYYFDQLKTLKAFATCLRSSWSFGRVDYSLSRGSCSSYVAKYVNSNGCLPSVFSNPAVRPFSLHSLYFATDAYRAQKKMVDKTPVSELITRSYNVNGLFLSVPAWRSFKSCFFPKCYRFGSSTDEQLIATYRIILQARQTFGQGCSLVSMTKQILHFLEFYPLYDPCNIPSVLDFFSLFCSGKHLHKSDKYIHFNRIYSILLTSSHFIDFCCNGSTDYNVNVKYIQRIKDFYSCLELANLRRFYASQETLLSLESTSIEDYCLFYNDFYQERLSNSCVDFIANLYGCDERSKVVEHLPPASQLLKVHPLYNLYKSDVMFKYRRSMKHKRLNDNLSNYFNIFNYE